MKINWVKDTNIAGVKLINYNHFPDERGFFTEIYNQNDFAKSEELSFLKDNQVVQANVSYSHTNVVRGLHFQWNPNMKKLIRVIDGAMVDLFLDIRKNSLTFGKVDGLLLESSSVKTENTIVWLPEGIAHGCVFVRESYIEYFCDASYNPQTQGTISIYSPDIDWSLLDINVKQKVDEILKKAVISDKDKNGFSLTDWKKTPESELFII